MSEQIIEVLEYFGEKFGIAVDWTQENVLPYVTDLAQRIIKYNIFSDIMFLCIFIALGAITINAFKVLYTNFKKAEKEQKPNAWFEIYKWFSKDAIDIDITLNGIFLIVLAIITGLFAIIGIPIMINDIMKWLIVPEVQLAKEIAYVINII